MTVFNINEFRQHFPILEQKIDNHSLVYFDNGATTQKPLCVIEKESEYYQSYNANVHRAAHSLSAQATIAFEKTRQLTQKFINARSSKEIIWTKGTTESINLIAQSWGRTHLQKGDEIVLSYAEHHANIVPWQVVAEQTGAIIKILPLDKFGKVDESQIEQVISQQTKIVCCHHVSNVIGKLNHIEQVILRAKQVGALSLIDGAQAIAHVPVDVQQLDCDFYVFSAHKMYGPMGLGILYGKQTLLANMPPYQTGGEMIKKVSFSATTYNELPFKFEAGTPNVAAVIAFSATLSFIERHQLNQHFVYEKKLTDYCFKALSAIAEVKFLTLGQPDVPIFSFLISGHHAKDIAASLDSLGIAVRVGHHCAMPLMDYLSVDGCLRLSLAPYNTFEEVDRFIAILTSILADDLSTNDQQKLAPVFQKDRQLDDVKIVQLFSNAKSWDAKHRELMLLGKKLDRLPKTLRSEQSLISGCESAAWLVVEKSPEGIFSFSADSEAKVIRGLLVVVFAAYNHKSAEQIIHFDIEEYFNALGLIKHLSPSRSNGLMAIVQKIKTLVS